MIFAHRDTGKGSTVYVLMGRHPVFNVERQLDMTLEMEIHLPRSLQLGNGAIHIHDIG